MSSSSQSSQALGIRRIQLAPFFQKRYNPNANDGFRIRIIVNAAENMPEAVFRYLRHPADANGDTYDECTGVCSTIDLEELPVDEPRVTDNPQTYRSAEFDMVFEAVSRAHETWDLIQAEVNQLVVSLNEMDILEALDPVWLEGT